MTTVRTEHLEGIGEVRVQKKRGVKRISLKLHTSGQVRVTQPYFVPFSAGLLFAKKHYDWITKQKSKYQSMQLFDGMMISKQIKLRLQQSDAIRTRLLQNELIVYTPNAFDKLTPEETILVKKAIKRAINTEAKQLLPERVEVIAQKHTMSFRSVAIKPLKSRWGSCSSTKQLTLNCYLVMLPWECIDYVIVHELAHTLHMNHGTDFWSEVARMLPDYKNRKIKLKKLQPELHSFYV